MKRVLVLVSVLAFAAGAAFAAPSSRPAWPQAHSDLKPDPAAVFGVLPNGLRYAIQHNTTPPGLVSMRLAIQAGSMQEAHDQEGLAHLIEHMAFRGSTHVPDGEAMKTLQRLGSRPGADANAGTGPTSTVYMFDLNRNDEATVDTGLMLLRETGSELSFDPKSLAAERPVVLAEERVRGGPNEKLSEALRRAEFGDHPFARSPIGRPEVIETAPVERLRAFYDAYYRPERAVLVIAGDIDPGAIEAKIKAKFSDWTGRGAAGGDPAPLNGDPGGAPVQVVTVPGVGHTSLLMLWPRAYEAPDASKARFTDELLDRIARVAFQRRLDKMETEPNAPFGLAVGGRYDIRGVATGASFEADAISDPARAVDQTLKAVRQAAAYGLSQAEVDQHLDSQRNFMANQAAAADTRQTQSIAGELLNSAMQDQVDLDPRQRLALFDEVRPTLTAARINARLRQTFEGAPRHLLYIGATAPAGGEPMLAKSLAQANQAPVSAYAFVAARPWGHTDFGPPGRVAERRTLDDLGVTFVRFANGVRLTVKPTDFAKDRVSVKLRFGHGMLDMPMDRQTAADWGPALLMGGGLADMNQQELGASLRARGALALVSAGEDGFSIANSGPIPSMTPATQLDLQLQLIAAYLTAPGWRPDTWPTAVRLTRDADRMADASPGAVFGRQAPLMLHSGDMRWSSESGETVATWKPQDAMAFMAPIVAEAPLELIVVGDVTVDQAIAAAAKTLGALPPRRETPEPPGLRDVRFPGATPTPIVLRHKGRADQAMLDVSWPATDLFADTRGYAAASVLSEILRNRATDQFRIAEGKTYSPNTQAGFSRDLPGYGRLAISVNLKPEDVDAVYTSIDAIAADLAAKPVAADEFARAAGPLIEAARRSLRINEVWLSYLSGAQTDPRRLAYVRDLLPELESIAPADVQAAARRWFVKDRSWRLTILPQTQTAAAPTASPAS